ncbi:MAG TPA: murein biosynthesis integral membrane protein MurJ [Verrucomicrobiae bacterium]|nr:murein biosynthesis integral membrane protein MurJ [Verrucomicrobiae bacterium]
MSEGYSVTRSARTVSLAVLGSRVLGLVREQVLAALFGAHQEFDAFVTAFRIPNLLRDLFAEGALSAAFVTTFSQKLSAEGDKAAWRLANLVLNALIVVLGVITVVGIVISPWLVRIIAPGFAATPGKVELTTTLTRIMFPFLLMVALAALAMGMLNAKHRFGVPASASMMFNIGSIVGGLAFAFLLAPGFLHDPSLAGRAMIGMSIGTLIGGAAQWLIQIPSLRGVGYRYEVAFDRNDPGFRQVLNLLGPSVIGTAVVPINIFVDQWFASYFGNGAVTWLNCAFRLMQFPIGLFGVAIGVAMLPTVSAHAGRGDMVEFRKVLARSIRLAFFLCVPAACGLSVLAMPIISTIYQHGKFDLFATQQTVACVQAFSVGLVAYAAIKIIAPSFYALGDSRTPMYVGFVSVGVNAGTDYLFAITCHMKTAGLALSTSTVALFNFFLLLGLMRRKIGRVEATVLLRSFLRVATAAAVMTAAAYGVHRFCEFNRYLDMLLSMTVAVLVFGAACYVLGVEELAELLAVMKFGSRNVSETVG